MTMGIVAVDGNVVKDLNIADLINDAMREKKLRKQRAKLSSLDYFVS